MQKSIALHLARAISLFNLMLAAINGIIVGFANSRDMLYAKTRSQAEVDISKFIVEFEQSGISDLISAVTEEAARQFSLDTNTILSENTILLGHQANVETLYNLRVAIKSQALSLNREAGGIIRRTLAKKVLKNNSIIADKISGNTLDSMGRQWQGSLYFKTLIRKAIIDAYVNAYSVISSEQGYDVIILNYDDHTHRNDGLTLSISGKSNYPTLDSVRKDVFHPNSTANIRALK